MKQPHLSIISRSRSRLEFILSDLCSKYPLQVLERFNYLISFIHDFPGFSSVLLLKNKSDGTEAVMKYILAAQTQAGLKYYAFRLDNRGKYVNKIQTKFLTN